MPCREILQLGHPILWEKSAAVDDATSAAARRLITDLDDTLAAFRAANGFGRGIAAPQIGILQRAIHIRMEPPGFCGTLSNPRIVWEDSRRGELWDDCFSFPDLLVRVSRATAIEVEYVDSDGQAQRLRAEGDLAELLQHEIDHLDGVLAIQRAVSPQAFCTRAEWLRSGRTKR